MTEENKAALNENITELTVTGGESESQLKVQALGQVLASQFEADSADFEIKEINPRLFEIEKSDVQGATGNRYLVATQVEYDHIRQTLVFDQIPDMDIDLIMEYCFQDLSPEEVKPVIYGILLADEGTVSRYTKSRIISMAINFEAMLRDFIRDESEEESGVYKFKTPDTENAAGMVIVVAEAFTTEADAQIANPSDEETEGESEKQAQ
jgi:hypothetical protein